MLFRSSGLTANVSARANVIASPVTVTIYDDTGAQIGTGTLALAASGHTSFMLDDLYPVVIGKRGWVRFAAADGFSLSIVGLRGNGGGLTTLPQLNDTGTGGGSISHFTFNAGFTSTLYILNPATTPASDRKSTRLNSSH